MVGHCGPFSVEKKLNPQKNVKTKNLKKNSVSFLFSATHLFFSLFLGLQDDQENNSDKLVVSAQQVHSVRPLDASNSTIPLFSSRSHDSIRSPQARSRNSKTLRCDLFSMDISLLFLDISIRQESVRRCRGPCPSVCIFELLKPGTHCTCSVYSQEDRAKNPPFCTSFAQVV